MASFRKNSHAAPCRAFVPDLIETFTVLLPYPNSADMFELSVLNSCISSMDGVKIMPRPFWLDALEPSIVNNNCPGLPPLEIFIVPVVVSELAPPLNPCPV
jgi:hypothetical protein